MKKLVLLSLVAVLFGFVFATSGADSHAKSVQVKSVASTQVAEKVCPKHAHHLTPGFSDVIDGDILAFDTVQACRIIRNDFYTVIFSDPCLSLMGITTLQADPEGRLSFTVMFDHCDPDFYFITLRDTAPNHVKYHTAVVLDAA